MKYRAEPIATRRWTMHQGQDVERIDGRLELSVCQAMAQDAAQAGFEPFRWRWTHVAC